MREIFSVCRDTLTYRGLLGTLIVRQGVIFKSVVDDFSVPAMLTYSDETTSM